MSSGPHAAKGRACVIADTTSHSCSSGHGIVGAVVVAPGTAPLRLPHRPPSTSSPVVAAAPAGRLVALAIFFAASFIVVAAMSVVFAFSVAVVFGIVVASVVVGSAQPEGAVRRSPRRPARLSKLVVPPRHNSTGSSSGKGSRGGDGDLEGVGESLGSLIDVGGCEKRRDWEVGDCIAEGAFEDVGIGSAEGVARWRGVGGCFEREDESDGAMIRAGLEVFSEPTADHLLFRAQRSEDKVERLLAVLGVVWVVRDGVGWEEVSEIVVDERAYRFLRRFVGFAY
ncbi:hypothetical protein NBRC10513v2_007503 [Rhodotorula toruloides]